MCSYEIKVSSWGEESQNEPYPLSVIEGSQWVWHEPHKPSKYKMDKIEVTICWDYLFFTEKILTRKHALNALFSRILGEIVGIFYLFFLYLNFVSCSDVKKNNERYRRERG